MNGSPFERYVRFVYRQSSVARLRDEQSSDHPAVVTISREAGCGAHKVAEHLVRCLAGASSSTGSPWTTFDKDLVHRVLADHNLPKQLVRFMPEDRISDVTDTLEAVFGLHPPSGLLVRNTAETILRLAEIGNAVIIGRASNIVTHALPYAFHVRLVGSFDRRVRHVEETMSLSASAAEEHVRRTDAAREHYVAKYYHQRIADPLLYDLVINTDRLSPVAVADTIIAGMAAAGIRVPVTSGTAAAG